MKFAVTLTGNITTIILHSYQMIRKAKLTKFRMIPDNITANIICVNIEGLNSNQIVSNTSVASYFFSIPFLNNNNASFFSNDVTDTWDYENPNGIELNKLVISITNETGQLLTLNNSSICLELLII